MTNIFYCKFVLSYTKSYEYTYLLHTSLQKFNNSEQIRPLNSAIDTYFVYNVLTVQKITLVSSVLPFELNQFEMEIQTNNSSLFKHQYRILKQDSQEFTTLSEWKQEYQQRTEPLYHEDRFGSNNSYISIMQMRHPYNSLKQYLKIRNITIYLIYRAINELFVDSFLISQSIRLTSSRVYERQLNGNSYKQYSAGL